MKESRAIIEQIKRRRTIKPEACIPGNIPDKDVWEILECANWAPTHGYTEPWRFFVFSGEAKHSFSKDHAEMYKIATPSDKFKQTSYDKMIRRAETTSHIIVYSNKRGSNPKIPEIEEIQSTAMAAQNIQLAATAMGYAAYIYSGGMTYKPEMKTYLKLAEEDQVLGILYLGIPNNEEKAPGRRVSEIRDKVVWKD